MHIKYPIYITNILFKNKKCYYDDNYLFSGEYAWDLEDARKKINGSTENNFMYANRRFRLGKTYEICVGNYMFYQNVILCHNEIKYKELQDLRQYLLNLPYMIPIYTININLKRGLNLSKESFNIQPIIKEGVNIKSRQKLVCGEHVKCALTIEDAQQQLGDGYSNGLYIIKENDQNYYAFYTNKDKKIYKFRLKIENIAFPLKHGFIFFHNEEEKKSLYGGLKKKIHTGKRGGKYYIKNSKKIYV